MGMSPGDALHLWGVISTDDRAENVVDQELEGIADPPGSTFVWQVSHSSEHLLQ